MSLQPDPATPVDRLLDAMDDGRRRFVCRALASTDSETVPLDDLCRAVAVREARVGSDDRNPDVERIRISLHHVHLPKLADVGLLDYDDDRNLVHADGRVDELVDRLGAWSERFGSGR